MKVFPAAALGGPDYLRAVGGPLPDVPLVATSGPNAENLGDYMDAGAVAVGVGKEVFTEGYSLKSVKSASTRVRAAMDAWRERS